MDFHNQMGGQQLSIMFNALSAVDALVWKADRSYLIKSIQVIWSAASSSGTVMIERGDNDTIAAGSGTDMLADVVTTSGSANTMTTPAFASAFTGGVPISRGQTILFDWSGTVTNLVNCLFLFELECR